MKALLFAYYFPPLGGIGSLRALGLARRLPEFGVETVVVAPRTGTYGRDPSLREPAEARVVRTGTLEPSVLLGRADRSPPVPPAADGSPAGRPARRGGALLRRLLQIPDNNVGWVPAAVAAGLRVAREFRPDVVLSSSPPLSAHLAASIVAARLRTPFCPDFRDFFDTQRLFRGIRERIDERIENAIFSRASGVIAATEGVLADLSRRTAAPGLVMVNGYDEEDFAAPPPAVPPEFELVHVGSSYAANRDPSAFLGAAADLLAEGLPARLAFLGAPDAALAAAVRAAGLSGAVRFGGFSTHEGAIAAMRAAPALLLFVWGAPGKIERGILAGKTLEYLRSGRPILVVGPADGETARLVREAGAGLHAEIEDRAGIRDALRALVVGRPVPTADPAHLAPYARRAQAERLAAWLAGILAAASGSRGPRRIW